MFVFARVTASPGPLLIVASRLLFFLLVFLFDVLNVADPRNCHDKVRKIHNLFATLYKSKLKEKQIFASDPISTCQNTGNMFLLYRSEDIVGEIVFFCARVI